MIRFKKFINNVLQSGTIVLPKGVMAFAVVLSVVLLTFTQCRTGKAERYVVVLSMDGFRSDYASKCSTPTLDSIAAAGVFAGFRPCYPANTFPNHYSMATGLHPDHHGLVNNSFYAKDLDRVYTMKNREAVENPAFYKGEPVWNTAERQGVKAATFYWVGSETAIGGRQASIWKKFDSAVTFSDRADSVISWLRLPKAQRPHLIMWYVEEPDATGHRASPDSSAVYDMVESLDKLLGRFFAKASKLDIFNKIDFIFVSDHGMATYYPENYINLYDDLPIDSFRYVFDGTPTFLYTTPAYVDKAYAILKTIPNIDVYKKEEMPEKYHYGTNERVADLIVQPHIGTNMGFRKVGYARYGGAHGYDNFEKLMEGIFYAVGPDFKKGYAAPSMANLNLYLIICDILGIEPASNDCEPEVVNNLFREPEQ